MKRDILVNQSVQERFQVDPVRSPIEFHRRLPGYEPTRLVSASGLARRLGVRQAWVKLETQRFGLPAFKVLGASWAVYRVLQEKVGPFDPWVSFSDLVKQVQAKTGRLSLTAATDGNHGRAVARMARLFGFGASIFVPAGTAKARIEAIESEGATVTVVDGTYDDAVARAAAQASDDCLLIADTDPEGKDPVPLWVIEGYSTIFWEFEEQLATDGLARPDIVVVQIGVGALAHAAVAHFRREAANLAPKMVGVEPLSAACVLASVQAGRPVLVDGPHNSIMAGLNCGFPSLAAWPTVSRGFDVFVAIDDSYVPSAIRSLADEGIEAGETGVAGVAGLIALTEHENDADALRAAESIGLGPDSRVLFICTEGVTDPESYRAMLADEG